MDGLVQKAACSLGAKSGDFYGISLGEERLALIMKLGEKPCSLGTHRLRGREMFFYVHQMVWQAIL
jgi:hypothetical protein